MTWETPSASPSLPLVSPPAVATSSQIGLTSEAVRARIRTFGPNVTPDSEERWIRRVLGKFIAPVPCLLEAAIVLQVYLGENVEATVIAFLLLFNAILGLTQEGRARATIAALKSRLALSATALRDGAWTIIPAAELVPGDVIKVTLGTVVPADARLSEGSVLLDQSMLTGESLPVEAGSGFEAFAGALVRRGEAIATVTATGSRTKFGRTAELVRAAYVTSSQQSAVLRVVLYLAGINGLIALGSTIYAAHIGMATGELVSLALIAVLASVPVALPATFTLATAIGAQALARCGVLPTRLSAVDEAATMNVLCVDKTGTLTRNELAVTTIHPMQGFSEGDVMVFARLASADAGPDPVDAAIRARASEFQLADAPILIQFIPFDPASKRAEAIARNSDGRETRVVKGAFATVATLCRASPIGESAANDLERQGFRVLGVARGDPGAMQLVGLIALSDPPRNDSRACIGELRQMGVTVVMVTGDAAATASFVAQAVGLSGEVCPPGAIPSKVAPGDYAIFAGVLPEDKFKLVRAYQSGGYTVGMCGDGANDAPALRQAHIGIAVSSATDVAKSAAGVVLTEPGLAGILAAVREGRVTFQRILTYTLRSLVHKIRQVLFLAFGLFITGHAILTPMLMVLMMISGDFLAMSSTTDNVHPSAQPNAWRIGRLTLAGVILGVFDLAFCMSALALGKFKLGFDIDQLRTLTLVILVFSGQAVFYVVRERRHLWASMPSGVVIALSVADLMILPSLALTGTLMSPLPAEVIAAVFGSAALFAFVLDFVKVILFRRLGLA